MAPQPSPPAPPSPSPASAPGEAAPARRLPRLEDFPETGPNALATIQQRGLARVADLMVIMFPWALALSTVSATSFGRDLSLTEEAELPLYLTVIAFAAHVLYELVAVAWRGQTLGKWLAGIRVARYTDGARPTWAQSALRCLLWAAPAAASLVLFRVWVIGAAPVFFSAMREPLHRAWHDEAGGTIVVRTR